MWFADTALVISLALPIEAVAGYPDAMFRAIGHPVVWIGALIARLDAGFNRETAGPLTRRLLGCASLLIVLAAAVLPALAVAAVAPALLQALLAATLLAQRSLHAHVRDVATALRTEGLADGRREVSRIVGRNPATLDEAGVARAAIESLAENFSDGVVAPALWCAVAGLPGIAGYKAVNTADSMIGHRTPRHAAFGWAAARLDDVVNLPASRLAALWLVLAALLHRRASARGALAAVWRDAGRHRSPNAGWPEAAMAGALGLRLAGPRVYGDTRIDDAFMGDGRADVTAADIDDALALYRTACALQMAAAVALAVIVRS
ncbi:MAG TPA: adenosylcobinamide-phosphate synthase CbiB [Acidisphaera sp.]|nr:adenosylcobinamide-phosphate synthase CbiB [Acidisphaera sp.]